MTERGSSRTHRSVYQPDALQFWLHPADFNLDRCQRYLADLREVVAELRRAASAAPS